MTAQTLRYTPFVLLLLSACTTGSKQEEAKDLELPQGLWVGPLSTGVTVQSLILSDGSYWALYLTEGLFGGLVGAAQGTGTASDGTFTSTDGLYFEVLASGPRAFTLDATYVEKESFLGTVTFAADGEVSSFSTTYDPAFDLKPDVRNLAGHYAGSAATFGDLGDASVTLVTDGSLTGTTTGGCEFIGTIAPRHDANAYDVNVTFQGGDCVAGTTTQSGVAYYDAATEQLYAEAFNTGRTGGFLFAGTKL